MLYQSNGAAGLPVRRFPPSWSIDEANIAELPELLSRTSCPLATPGISYKPVSRVRHRMIDILR
jgi:hypothetical protein